MKNKFLILSLKKHILPFMFSIFTVCLVLFSNSNLNAARSGISLWANSVLPSLLPFFIATELLNYTNVVDILGKIFSKIMRPLFNVPGEGAYALIMGIISGYPVGAKVVSKLKEEKKCNDAECERLLAFTNNSGPLFIIGTVGISFLGDTQTGFLLFISHILACISVGLCFKFWKKNTTNSTFILSENIIKRKNNIGFKNLGEILSICIFSAIKTVVMIGGFIVLFSVIMSILVNSKIIYIFSGILAVLFKIPSNFSESIITGIVELTNGLKLLCNINTKNYSTIVILASFLLGFGGFSIMLQVLSIASKANISIKPYIIGKILQGIFASIYTYIFLYAFPIFNLNLKPVFYNIKTQVHPYNNIYNIIFLFILVFLFLYFIILKKKLREQRKTY